MIGRVLDPVREGAVFRLGRLFQTFAASVVEPTVVAAPDAGLFDPPELKRRAAMGAVELQEPQLTTPVAEKNKVFAQEPHFDRRAFQPHFLTEAHRPPITHQRQCQADLVIISVSSLTTWKLFL
jgi:hypothetical protein